MIPKLVFFLVFAITFVWAGQRCCDKIGCHSDDHPFNHLPLPECLHDINPTFSFYSNAYPHHPLLIKPGVKPSYFDPELTTVVMIHGFQSHGRSESIMGIKDGFLNRGNYNVIGVCWEEGAETLYYPQAAANTRSVARAIALMLEDLVSVAGLKTRDVYCVGHSLGAHTCGHLGQLVKIGRITGLDPAGPLFGDYSDDAGLSKDDAFLVDVIHSMGKGGFILDFGTLKPMGHLDFYPNGGGIQPGCINSMYYNSSETDNPEFYGDFGCSHSRAKDYFIESLTSDCEFRAELACVDPYKIPESCKYYLLKPVMGVQADNYGFMPGNYYLTTNDNAPFCK